MSRRIILSMIIGIAVLGFIGFSQEAEAATMTFTTDTTISSESIINNGETCTINPDVTLTINAGIENHGDVVDLGTIVNTGDFNSRPMAKLITKA